MRGNMEIRILRDNEMIHASGLSRYVFDNCLRERMEFPQSIGFIEDYLKYENLTGLVHEGKLTVWGVFEQEQCVAISGLQSDGMITLLYVLPQCFRRGYGSALLRVMKEYAKNTYGMNRIMVNATPAWTATYFIRNGFAYQQKPSNMHVPFITLYADQSNTTNYPKKRVSWPVIIGAGIGCFLFVTILCIAFLISYIM